MWFYTKDNQARANLLETLFNAHTQCMACLKKHVATLEAIPKQCGAQGEAEHMERQRQIVSIMKDIRDLDMDTLRIEMRERDVIEMNKEEEKHAIRKKENDHATTPMVAPTPRRRLATRFLLGNTNWFPARPNFY